MKNRRKFTEITMYLLPAIAVIGFVYFFPLVKVFQYSFMRIKGTNFDYIGMTNYINLFKNPKFIEGIKNNFVLLISVPIILIAAIFFAVLLYEKMGGWKFYRFTLFLPYILAIPVVGVVFGYIFQLNGILNFFLEKLGLDFLISDWFGSSKLAIWTLMFVIMWKELGFSIIMLFARLLSVNQELYEAAEIDGASWLKKHIHITIPQCINVISFLSVILIITMFAWIFNYVFTLTRGGPGNSTMVSEFYIYETAFRDYNQGMGSAASVILFIIMLAMIIIYTKLFGREETE
ncbi:MAG: sugar ABC transporter permease [Actinobacteria bacterium]|nr:sugar ABC transporter permease [Actinomycetota bacterium]